jgi:hypothetical protein
MKKIMSRKEIDKKEQRNKLIIGITMVVLMVSSIIGYAFFSADSPSSKKIRYNNIDFFFFEDGRWHFILNNKEFATTFNPEEVKDIEISGDFSLQEYSNLPFYIHFENNKQIEQEILYNLGGYFQRINNFCFQNENCTWVEKNCSEDNLLIIREFQNSSVIKEDKCIYLYYNETEGLKIADSFIFKLLEIV